MARLFERGNPRVPGDMVPAQGLGLGLYIVRRVVEMHAGSADLLGNAGDRVAFRRLIGAGDE